MKLLLALLVLLFFVFLSWPIAGAGSVDKISYSTSGPESRIPESPTQLKLHWETIAEGRVGYYGDYFKEGDITRSGRPYSPDGDILAVDSALYSMLRLQGQGVSPQIILENLESGDRWIVHAADSGYFPLGYIGDLGDESWLLVSGKPASSGVFRAKLYAGRVE